MTSVDLSKVPSQELRAELDRRKDAAQRSGKPMRFATKREWAQHQLDGARNAKAEMLATASVASDFNRMRQRESLKILDGQIDKFARLVDLYTKKGI